MPKHILHKRSVPGWSKEFATRKEVAKALRGIICGECFKGEYSVVGTDEIHKVKPPKLDSPNSLLGTSCGLEYEYEVINE